MPDDASQKFKDLIINLNKLSDSISDPTVVKVMANKTVDQIKKRTRAGFGISSYNTNSARIERLKLKPQTKKRRRNLNKRGELTGPTSPAKANLTRSGDMLDDITASASGGTSYTVSPSRQDQDKVNNLDKQGHRFLGLTKKELASILKDSFRVFEKLINKLNNV